MILTSSPSISPNPLAYLPKLWNQSFPIVHSWTIISFVSSLKVLWKSYVNIVINILNDFGFYINLPYDKIIKARTFSNLIHNRCSLGETISFLGLVVSHLCALKFPSLHYRPVQLCYIDNVNRGKIIMIFSFFHLMMVLWMTFLGGFLALIFSFHSVSYHFPCKDFAINYVR